MFSNPVVVGSLIALGAIGITLLWRTFGCSKPSAAEVYDINRPKKLRVERFDD